MLVSTSFMGSKDLVDPTQNGDSLPLPQNLGPASLLQLTGGVGELIWPLILCPTQRTIVICTSCHLEAQQGEESAPSAKFHALLEAKIHVRIPGRMDFPGLHFLLSLAF